MLYKKLGEKKQASQLHSEEKTGIKKFDVQIDGHAGNGARLELSTAKEGVCDVGLVGVGRW